MRALRRAGFELHHVSGSHHVFRHAASSWRVTVPYHKKDLKRGTLPAIIDQVGISVGEFLDLL
jgi:predicted RNA binding protein YcfA (HicA-like mRNA interferase family)